MPASAGAKQLLPSGEEMGQGCPNSEDFYLHVK